MKLATFTDGDGARIGIVVGELVIDLSAAAPDLPTDMTAFLPQVMRRWRGHGSAGRCRSRSAR